MIIPFLVPIQLFPHPWHVRKASWIYDCPLTFSGKKVWVCVWNVNVIGQIFKGIRIQTPIQESDQRPINQRMMEKKRIPTRIFILMRPGINTRNLCDDLNFAVVSISAYWADHRHRFILKCLHGRRKERCLLFWTFHVIQKIQSKPRSELRTVF